MTLLLPLFAMLAVPQAAATALTVGEVEALTGKDARVLATRVLPPAVAARVVAGKVRRQWLPGQVWWIGFREPARVAGADLCERQGHAVQAAAPAAADKAAAATALTIGAPETWTEAAVLPAGTRADPATCEAAAFIAVQHDPTRRIAAYRVLIAAMAAARGRTPLPFAVTCEAEKPAACADARGALAALPMAALSGIGVSCLESERVRRDGFITCPPLANGRPYAAEASFGMSGEDGQSWRVAFVHRPGWPETIALRRSTVIYH